MRLSDEVRNGPNDVYWIYDAEGRVLYIGCSCNVEGRLEAHSKAKDWWHSVSRVEVESFANRAEARGAEDAAIERERPIHNKQYPKKRPGTRHRRLLPSVRGFVTVPAVADAASTPHTGVASATGVTAREGDKS